MQMSRTYTNIHTSIHTYIHAIHTYMHEPQGRTGQGRNVSAWMQMHCTWTHMDADGTRGTRTRRERRGSTGLMEVMVWVVRFVFFCRA